MFNLNMILSGVKCLLLTNIPTYQRNIYSRHENLCILFAITNRLDTLVMSQYCPVLCFAVYSLSLGIVELVCFPTTRIRSNFYLTSTVQIQKVSEFLKHKRNSLLSYYSTESCDNKILSICKLCFEKSPGITHG